MQQPTANLDDLRHGQCTAPVPALAMVDEARLTQPGVLRQVDALLAEQHIRWWLRGGWAIDFLLGAITRPHADLDLVLWARHRRRALAALLAAGFQLERETASQVDLRYQTVELSLVFVLRS